MIDLRPTVRRTHDYRQFRRNLDALLRRSRIGLPYAGMQPKPGDVIPDKVPTRIGAVRLYIDEHAPEVDDLEALARRAHLSKYHFARQFRAETGRSPWAYVQEVRIREAKRLLADTERPLADIALEAGFYDQAHLTRVFKKAEGETPGQYRERLQSGESAEAA